MNIILGFIICFILLVFSTFKGIFVGYALGISLLIFMGLSYMGGFSVKQVLNMAYKGGKKSFAVIQIFILIGAITSIWMASGTVPFIVYYGLKFLSPKSFILSAFLVCTLVSFLMGTSLGTVGTVGITLMVMARSGGANISLTAGAILSGAFFGDRCSPMSSSANLVANLTETELSNNIKNMVKTSIIPFTFSVIIYLLFSYMYPLREINSGVSSEILKNYNISF